MEIKVIVEDEYGNIYRTTTDNQEIAEAKLDQFVRLVENTEKIKEDCKCEEDDYPEEYESDLDEIILDVAEKIKKKKSYEEILKQLKK